jgi:hypothetical protein
MKETQGDLLPSFTAEDSKLLRTTTVDFFSVNFYCGYYVWAPAPGSPKELVSARCCRCCCVWSAVVVVVYQLVDGIADSNRQSQLRLLRVGTWLTQGAGERAML